jgi:hypothetical protein
LLVEPNPLLLLLLLQGWPQGEPSPLLLLLLGCGRVLGWATICLRLLGRQASQWGKPSHLLLLLLLRQGAVLEWPTPLLLLTMLEWLGYQHLAAVHLLNW